MEKEYQERNIKIEKELKEDLLKVTTNNDLVQVKAKYLGKTGIISDLTKNMKDLKEEERIITGKYASEIRNIANNLLKEKEEELKEEELNKRLREETIDITLPSKKIRRGSIHPFNMIVSEIEDLFVSMGYDIVKGPELETDEYCFKRLNIPE